MKKKLTARFKMEILGQKPKVGYSQLLQLAKVQRDIIASVKGGPESSVTQAAYAQLDVPNFSKQNITMTRILGQGGFGIVVKGIHRAKEVATKIIHPSKLHRNQKNELECKEIDFLKQAIGVPNILQMKGVFFDMNLHIVTELCKGSLSNVVLVSLPNAAKFAAQMIDGLEWMETKFLVHCDLKLCNVLIGSDNNIRIADFGECIRLPQGKDMIKIKHNIGTIQRAHLECNKNRVYGFRTDIFAVGIILFEFITGMPFMQAKFKVPLDKELEFYVQCFTMGRVKEDGNNPIFLDGKYMRERLIERIMTNVIDKSFQTLILKLTNTDGELSGIPLASEIKNNGILDEILNTHYGNESQKNDSIELRDKSKPMEFMPKFDLVSFADATFLAVKFYFDADSDTENQEARKMITANPTSGILLEKSRTQRRKRLSRKAENSSLKAKKTNAKMFVCRICGVKFSHQSNLYRHNTVHKGEKKYACEMCSRRFHRSDGLKSHIKTHINKKLFSCSHCNHKTKSKHLLMEHKKNKHKNIA